MPAKPSGPVSHHNDQACRQNSLFFHGLYPIFTILLPVIFAIIASVLTKAIRNITPGIDHGSKPSAEVVQPSPSNIDIEATAIPDATASAVSEDEEHPPPYQPPAPVASTPVQTPAPTEQKVKRSSAELFVCGTALFTGVIAFLFLSALALQALIFCAMWSPVSIGLRVVYWIVFTIPCLWSTVGASCWLMLLRDLWGPAMRKRVPITETALLSGLFYVLIGPFACLVGGIGGLSVRAIELCQKRFCGDALEEMEDIEENVELEEGLRMEDTMRSTGSTGTVQEERIGLIEGIEK